MDLDTLRAALPESAKDISLNLQAVLRPGLLSATQRYCIAIASAVAARSPLVRDAILTEAKRELGTEASAVIDDAVAAASLMAMNNVYYRFRHLIGKASYSEKPARLRMNRLVKPLTSRTDFELTCLAVSAIHGCETCVRAHEKVVLEGGLTEDHVHDAVRIAATIHAAVIASEAELNRESARWVPAA